MLGAQDRPKLVSFEVVKQDLGEQWTHAGWRAEDFFDTVDAEEAVTDFWNPSSRQKRSEIDIYIVEKLNSYPDNTGGSQTKNDYYFSFSGNFDEEEALVASEWANSAPLPGISTDAAANPFIFAYAPVTKIDMADRRAGWLVNMLDIGQSRCSSALKYEFKEIFVRHPHAATFRAFSDLVLLGATADEVLTTYELRELCAVTPIWWSVRRPGKLREIFADPACIPSWRKCWKFVVQSGETVAEKIFDADWFREWVDLTPDDGTFWRFVDYVETRITHFGCGALRGPIAIVRDLREIAIVGDEIANITNNPSRTGTLVRLQTDSWVSTKDGQTRNDVLTPKKTFA